MNEIRLLDFEATIAPLYEQLNRVVTDSTVEMGARTAAEGAIKQQIQCELARIYCGLTDYQIASVARHIDRPSPRQYRDAIFSQYVDLKGDKVDTNDPSLFVGIGYFGRMACIVAGTDRGECTQSKLRTNFGMPGPSGYRKLARAYRIARRFHLPVVTFVDTPGAYPGVDAEMHNQSEAIATAIAEQQAVAAPTVAIVTGEGGSGGALALCSTKIVAMLEYATYSVISPEGCASITWKSTDYADHAASALQISAHRLLSMRAIDAVISEPIGGAHRGLDQSVAAVRDFLRKTLESLAHHSIDLSEDDR